MIQFLSSNIRYTFFKYIKAAPILTEAVCGRVWMTHIPAFLDFFLGFLSFLLYALLLKFKIKVIFKQLE